MKLRTPVLLLALAFALLPVLAAEPGMVAELEALRTDCKPDIERLCASVEPGGGRIKECLQRADLGGLRLGPGEAQEGAVALAPWIRAKTGPGTVLELARACRARPFL